LQKDGVVSGNVLNGGLIALYLDRDTTCQNNTLNNPIAQGIFISLPSYNLTVKNNNIINPMGAGITVKMQVDHIGANGEPLLPNSYRSSNINIVANRLQDVRSNGIELSNLKDSIIRDNNISIDQKEIISNLVKNGLIARLSSPIPVVGSQYIELIFDKHYKAHIVKSDNYDIFPTIKKIKSKKDIMDNINGVLVKLKNLPLEKMLNSYTNLAKDNRKPIHSLVKNLDKTVKNLNKTINNLNYIVNNLNNFISQQEFTKLPENINNLLQEIEITLIDLQQLTQDYSANSQFADQLSATLKATSDALKSFDKTNQVLSRKANSLIVGDE